MSGAILADGPSMLLDPASKRQFTVDALEDALLQAEQDGMPSPVMTVKRDMVRGPMMEAFRRGLTMELLARVTPKTVAWKPNAKAAKARPRLYALKKRGRMPERMCMMEEAGVAYPYNLGLFPSVAMAMPKGDPFGCLRITWRSVNKLSPCPGQSYV